jgi:hypothetical protein
MCVYIYVGARLTTDRCMFHQKVLPPRGLQSDVS